MPINITNPEADSLTRRFALMEGVGITEAIARRLATETPIETAARLRAKHGIAIRCPPPRSTTCGVTGVNMTRGVIVPGSITACRF